MDQKATFAVILCALIAGVTGIFIKAMPTMTATSIAGLRMLVPTIAIGYYLKRNGIKILFSNTNYNVIFDLLIER